MTKINNQAATKGAAGETFSNKYGQLQEGRKGNMKKYASISTWYSDYLLDREKILLMISTGSSSECKKKGTKEILAAQKHFEHI